ncbi:MAG: cytochrome c1 [Planctomycetia bacterium]|nr:cytochrome c1 [Planctomycetia bacterium]
MIRYVFVTGLVVALISSLATAKSPIVAGFERFHADGSPRGGRLLATELGCVNCHTSGDKTLLVKQGPILTEVGSRVRVSWLRKYLSDPHATKPGTTMPHVLANDPDAKDKVEALVHLLASTASAKHDRAKGAAAGRDLYGKVGCVACHGPRDASGKEGTLLPSSVPLGDLVSKYTLPGLTKFLQNPAHTRPSGRMPKLLDDKMAADVASYLLQGQKMGVQGGTGTTGYKYYQGSWDRLPDFSKLTPAGEGVASGIELAVATRDSDYAVIFEGYFEIKKEGKYSFVLNSDDGSKLYIDGKLVVDNDLIHAPVAKRGETELKVGVHSARIEFFQGGGGAELTATINGPGVKNRPLGDLLSATKDTVGKSTVAKGIEGDDITIDPALVEKGKGVFASAGCASCHTLAVKGKPIESGRKGEALVKLSEGKGCLSDRPGMGVPVYGLSDAQKKALASAIKALPEVKASKEVIAETMTVFNCYACHARDKVGGVQPDLDKAFQTVQPEMGDEGRLPPPLDGAGAKLQADYLNQILNNGAHHRPYMHTRMPGFGGAVPAPFVAALKESDKLPAIAEVKFADPIGKVKSQARYLSGGTAFGCIKCHTFNGKKAEGVQGIDMTLMPQRLERDWFHAYIANPQAVRPGTRMPASFVLGKSVLPDVLDGTAVQQIEALWIYLKDGATAQAPAGMTGGKYIPLVPTTTAILYRNFIEGAGARAIAVGYPEKMHLAFDANGLRLAMIWQGDFMNAGRHWTDRGVGYEPPAGDNIVRLHSGVPFAVLKSVEEVWPTDDVRKLGWRFRGYTLDDKERPTFRYALGEIEVQDLPLPEVKGKATSLKRTFSLTAPAGTQEITYRAAVSNKIEPVGDGAFKVDGTWTIKATSARVRKSAGKDELIVPVSFKDGKATFAVEYVW